MRTCLRFAPVVVAFWLVAAARGAESKTIVLGDDKGIVVRLTYLTEATLADAEFLKLEFENTTGKPVPLGHGLFYDIKYESSDAVTLAPLVSGNLGIGWGREAFGDGATTSDPPVLPEGKTINSRSVSEQASNPLGYPSANGKMIKAHVRVTLPVTGEAKPREMAQDFTFLWKQPDAAGITALQKEVRGMLAEKTVRFTLAYKLVVLLEVPAIADAISTEEFLSALDVLEPSGFSGRDEVVRYLADKRGREPLVVDHYLQRIKAFDVPAVADLERAVQIADHDLWDDAFAKELVAFVAQADDGGLTAAMNVLDRHAGVWSGDAKMREALSVRVLTLYPQLKDRTKERNAPEDNKAIDWEEAMILLPQTHDPKMVEVLRPLLGDKRVIHTWDFDSMVSPDQKLAPTRLCDAAYNAILVLQGKPKDQIEFRYAEKVTPGEELARRDKLIENIAKTP